MSRIIGVDKRNLPDQHGRLVEITVVLTEGRRGGDYAAYYGSGSPEWVAAHGNKLHHLGEVEAHFPISPVTEENYRR